MENYDEIIGFDYTDVNEWGNFVKGSIIPLNKSANKFLKVREFLENNFAGEKLSEVLEKEQNLKSMLLGGISEDGEYKKNSLAKIWKESIGIHVSSAQWVSLMKEEGVDANDYVNCEFSATSFLEFIREIKKLTDGTALNKTNEEMNVEESEIRNFINNPERILDEIKNVYELVTKLSANYNYHTFFILSLPSVPRKYLTKAYPRLGKNFENVESFLSLEKGESIKREEYVIYSYKEGGFGKSVYALNKLIWEFLTKEEIRNLLEQFFFNVPNLKKDYYEMAQNTLEKIGWKFPDFIGRNERYFFSEEVITHSGSGTSSGFYFNKLEKPITLFHLLDVLSPALFLKKLEIVINSPFVYEEVKVGKDKKKIEFEVHGE